MDISSYLELTWIPLIVFAFCLAYGVKILISKEPKAVKKENDGKVFKDAPKYCTTAGILLIVFGVASLIMSFIVLYNLYVATAWIVTVFLVIAALWKRMENKYGPL